MTPTFRTPRRIAAATLVAKNWRIWKRLPRLAALAQVLGSEAAQAMLDAELADPKNTHEAVYRPGQENEDVIFVGSLAECEEVAAEQNEQDREFEEMAGLEDCGDADRVVVRERVR